MINRMLMFIFFVFSSFYSQAQEVPKSIVYGTYTQQEGLPGRTIKHGDGSESHLMPVVQSEAFLYIKRFGRAKQTTIHHTMGHYKMSYKYRWRIENDTLIIWPKSGKGTEEKYLMNSDSEHVYSISLVGNSGVGYSKVFE